MNGTLFEILQWAVAAMVALLVWISKNALTRLKRLEDCTVKKADFTKLADYVHNDNASSKRVDSIESRAEASRSELRQGIIELHRKIDELQKLMITCIQTRTPHQ